MRTVTLTNLVSNALFASGTGWTGYDSISGGVMTDTGSGWAGAGASTACADIAGHIFYFAISAKTTNVASSARYGLGYTSGGGSVFEAPWITINTPGYVRNSYLRTSAATGNVFVAVYESGLTVTVYANGFLYIDLTAAFGAGKEPPVEWCDANIPFFNGTASVILATTNHLKKYRRSRITGSITGL